MIATGILDVGESGFLGRLTPRLLDELMLTLRSAWYPAGARLRPSLALVFSGRLRCFGRAPDGREVTLREALPGDLVGSVRARGGDTESRLEALQPTVLLHLDAERVMALAERWPELTEALPAA